MHRWFVLCQCVQEYVLSYDFILLNIRLFFLHEGPLELEEETTKSILVRCPPQTASVQTCGTGVKATFSVLPERCSKFPTLRTFIQAFLSFVTCFSGSWKMKSTNINIIFSKHELHLKHVKFVLHRWTKNSPAWRKPNFTTQLNEIRLSGLIWKTLKTWGKGTTVDCGKELRTMYKVE